MNKPILINVVSGKGGTGKSLMCAVMARMVAQEGARVLLVDFDLFVRGLSHLFYLFLKEKRNITENVSVSDFYGIVPEEGQTSPVIATERFYEVDILPAVSEIEKQLDYFEIEKDTVEKTRHLLEILRSKHEYDYIIVDNRAGVDELILETSRFCDLSICVSESDPISKTTNENLLRHLNTHHVGKVYTVINKAKYIRSLAEYEDSAEQIRSDFTVLGRIPFDVDLFERFGTSNFWDKANATRYAYAVAETWNKLSNREGLNHKVDMRRFPKSDLWPGGITSPAFFNRIERLSILFALVLFGMYFIYDFVVYRDFQMKDVFLIYGVFMLAVPVFRRLLVQEHGDREIKKKREQ